MCMSKNIKKTIVVAAAAGLMITTSVGTVSAGQLLNDSTVGISTAFDKYANTRVGSTDDTGAKSDNTASENAVPDVKNISTSRVGTSATPGSGDDRELTEENSQTAKDISKDEYPQFKGKCIAVTDDYVNIRSDAGTDSDVVGIIGNNGVSQVLEKGKEWTKISSGNCVGYIRNDLLLYGDDAGKYAENNCSKMATVSTDTLNVRESADASADCLTQVGSGQSFDILSSTDEWVEIALDEETSGYVSSEFIDYTYKLDEARTIEEIQAEIKAQKDAATDAEGDEADGDDTDSSDEADDGDTDSSDEADDGDTDSSDEADGDDTDSSDEADDGDTDSSDEADDGDTDSSDEADDGDTDSSDEADGDDTDSEDSEEDSQTPAAPSGQTGIDLANYATQFVGNPYVYGGSSLTDGADCSGFVMAVYAQFGYSLPHSAGGQSEYGTRVDVSSLEPGDIVFYGDGSSIGHCAIYIGGGMVVHASSEETGIKLSDTFYRTPMCAVRLIGQ